MEQAEHVLYEQARYRPARIDAAYWRRFRGRLVETLHTCQPFQEPYILRMIQLSGNLARSYAEPNS